jgi:plastocyanin
VHTNDSQSNARRRDALREPDQRTAHRVLLRRAHQRVRARRWPKTIEIDAGRTVTWTNHDNFTHTVKVDGQADHKVGRGDSVSIRFDKPGTCHYVCTLHSHDMHGTVIVT